MTRRIVPMVLVCALAGRALAADAGGDASVLLQQGQRLEKEGRPEMALELYKAALLIAPKDAQAHLATARTLAKLTRCDEAVPEYRAYFELAPAKAKSSPDYADAVVRMAGCLRETQAVLEVKPNVDARCTVDGAPARDAGPSAAARFELSPGLHQVSCTREGRFPAHDSVALASKEHRTLELTLANEVHEAAPATPPPAPTPPAPAPTKAADPAKDVAPTDLVLPPLDSDSPPPPPPPADPAPSVTPPPAAPQPAPPAPSMEPKPPEPQPAPIPAPPPPAPAKTTGEIKIEAEGRGWTCQFDGGPLVAPDVAGEIYQDVSPGEHVIGCDKPGSEHVEARVGLNAGDQRIVKVKPFPKATGASPQPAHAPTPVPPPAPMGPVHEHELEWQFAGGFGPGLGTFGIGVGLRMDALGVMLGTGLYPLAVSGTYSFSPGRTGVYVSAGYLRVANGLLVGGSDVTGHGVWGGAGIDVRPDPNLSFRIGAGLGYNTTGLQSGPLTLDFNVAYIP